MRELTTDYKNCDYCMYADTCPRYKECEFLNQGTEDNYANELLIRLKKTVVQASTKLMPITNCDVKLSYDDKFSSYEYYRKMINDCLKTIRRGFTAYVFSEKHVADILRYEPDVCLVVKDDIIYISKNNNKNI